MKVSVVIPAFNEEIFLPHVLKSLKSQNFDQEYEIVVVDNNSTDKTAEIAKKFGARVIKEKKQGYAYACNAGFNAAKGEIIVRSDSDYIHTSDWLQKFWDEFQKDKKCIAMGGPTYPIEGGWLEKLFYCPGVLLYMYFLKVMRRGFLFPNMAVKRASFQKVGGFNEKAIFGEDIDLGRRLEGVGKVKLMPSIYVFASARRVKELGLITYIFRYNFENIIRVLLKKKIVVGLTATRPEYPVGFRKYNPYVYFVPWIGLIILAVFVIFESLV